MRAASQQSIPRELVQRIADLTARCAALSDYVRQATTASAEDVRTIDVQNLPRPIEFLTENGFAIIRSCEIDGFPAPTDGCFCFLVRDPSDYECEVTVEISTELIAETAFHIWGRNQLSSSFWICCAERHLADYLAERNHCPDGNRLAVQYLDSEDVTLAIRWERSDSQEDQVF